MAKRIIWICDECRKEATGFVLPPGWLETSLYANGRFYRYCFCGYSHLTQWSEQRKVHYQDRFAESKVEEVPQQG